MPMTNYISQKGVPQGSAVSPLIADTVMSRVPQNAKPEFPSGVKVFAYADNVGILGQTKRALEQAVKPLVHSAECSRFGFLRLYSKLPARRVVGVLIPVTDVLSRIADHKISHIDELLPWNYFLGE